MRWRTRGPHAAAFALCVAIGFAGTTYGTGITRAPQATTAATAGLLSCMKWRVAGLCFWLKCGFFGCKVKVSPKIFNYAPEAFTTTFTKTGIGPISLPLIDGAGNIEQRKGKGWARDHQIFRDADLYGHPLGAAIAGLSGLSLGLICASRAVPMFPYFESPLDAVTWRGIAPVESLYPAAFIPGLREIGSFPLNTWGNVYPRTGRVVQQSEPKAGAVIAQRVGDIVTRTGQPHVYVPLSSVRMGTFGMKYWDPPPLKEADPSTGTWQMFHPKLDKSCYAFGDNDSLSLASWSDLRRSADGEYGFNLWRPYKCCLALGKFLFSIDF